MNFNRCINAFALSLLLVSVPVFADMPNRWQDEETENASQTKTSYDEGMKWVQGEKYDKALTLFKKASESDPNNADVLSMLAYTQRKLGMLDQAFANYEKALRIRPKFPEAREYLGEAHIQAALKEIETLKNYGEDAKEEHEDLIRALKEAAAAVN